MKENKGMERREGIKNWIRKTAYAALAALTMFYANGLVVHAASGNYGQNAALWFLDQIFWIVLAAVVVIAAICILKKNTVGAIVTVIVGVVVLVLIKNPMILTGVGENIVNKILQ